MEITCGAKKKLSREDLWATNDFAKNIWVLHNNHFALIAYASWIMKLYI